MSYSSQPIIRKARPGEEAQLHEAHMRSIKEVCSRDHTAEEKHYRPISHFLRFYLNTRGEE
jgi:hypothetical protein